MRSKYSTKAKKYKGSSCPLYFDHLFNDEFEVNKLAAEFSVSRSPIREALKILASEKIIRLERMGAVVIGLTEKEIGEIYECQYF